MIPMALVTGFLGSGKTTFLQRLVERYRDRKIVYLVNEFSEVDIDGRLLELADDQMVTIPGGSIFCRCLVTEFIGHLRTIASDHGTELDGVIIEASGVADPKVVSKMLSETGLDRDFRLARVVTIVDPGSFLDLLETLPAITSQIEASDTAIVNKTDLHDEQAINAVASEVVRINPRLVPVRAQHCKTDIDVFADSQPRRLDGEYALCADPNYARMKLTPAGNVDLARLSAELARLRNVIYRLKGFVPTSRGVYHVDVSRADLALRPHAAPGVTPELVCIYPPEAFEDVKGLQTKLARGDLADNDPGPGKGGD